MKIALIVVMAMLAALALFTHISVSRLTKAHPPAGKFEVVDNVRLHYKETGSGPPIVLIHGSSTSLLDFEESLVDPLSVNHRVIAVDRPGLGYSERPPGEWTDPSLQARLIHQLLQTLGVENPVLVGHSWAGSVVLAYLLNYPRHASGGVLLAGGSHPWQGGTAWHNRLADVPLVGDLFAWTLVYPLGRLLLEDAVATVFSPDAVPPDYIEKTGVELTLRPAVFKSNAQDVSMLSDFLERQQHRYPQISHPLLLITGENDDVVPAWNHADRLMRQVANAEKMVLERTGHAPHHTSPARVAGLIEHFSVRSAATPAVSSTRAQIMGTGEGFP